MRPIMSQHGATLQTYNVELVKCLEELKTKRNEILEVLNKEEMEKNALEKNIQILRDKLGVVNNSLQKHKALYESYEKTIQDTEAGFKKILESSQMLLNLAQQEADKLDTFNKNVACNKLTHDKKNSNRYEDY